MSLGKRLFIGGVSCTANTLQILGDSSCVATYNFENNANDLSGNYDGSGTGITYVTGKYGQSAETDDTGNTYVTFPNITNVLTNTSNDDCSISIWFNLESIPSSSSTYYNIFGKGNPTTSANYQMLYTLIRGTSSTNGVQFEFRRGYSGSTYDASSYNATATLSTDTWYHIVFVYDASSKEVDIYLQNSLIGTDTINSQSSGRTIESGFNIGSYREGTNGFPGKFDQLRIFNKVISASEVSTLYNETGC